MKESGADTMFMGEFQHNIDEKGRIIVPAKFRESLGETFVVTRGLDQCLFAYPMDEWHILEKKLKRLPLTIKDERAFTRFFFFETVICYLYMLIIIIFKMPNITLSSFYIY